MKSKTIAKLFASLLAGCMLLTSCAPGFLPDSGSGGGKEQTEIKHEQIKFSEIEYVRPDLDGMNAKIDRALSYVEEGGRQEETLALYQEIIEDLMAYETMDTLASIRHDLDLTDAFYDAEMTLLDNEYTKFDNRMNELTEAIVASPYAKTFQDEWGKDFIARYRVNSKLNSPEIEALSERETDLTNQYTKLAATEYTTTLDGEEVTVADLDLTTQEGVAAYYEIYAKKNEELGEIYRQLVQLRVEIAQILGYDNYTDYAYDLLGRDYTKEDAAAFANKVKTTLVPLYQEIDATYYDLIRDAKMRSTVTLKDGIPTLQKALKAEYPEKMSEALDYMLKYGFYDFSESPNKTHAGYSTMLNTLAAPFMFINPSDYQSPDTVFHEFGHYYNFYLMGPTIWNDGNNLDTAEIHSQALETLMFSTYDELYGDDAELFEYEALLNLLGSVIQGCAEDEFQQKVFENPEMSLADMNKLHGRIYQSYMGYPLVYEWVDIHHHFETPFYYISYATSAISALEVWEISTESRKKALDIYDQLTRYTINVEYLTALKESGLSNPFKSKCVEQIGAALEAETGLGGRAA